MKRISIITISTLLILAASSCRGSYDATKAAYEKAMQAAVDRPTITADTPTDDAITPVMPMIDNREVKERSESFQIIGDGTAGQYNIVVGSYKQLTNANSMRDRFREDGYQAFVVQNAHGMYRVIACTAENRKEAEKYRQEIILKYPQAYVGNPWLLVQ